MAQATIATTVTGLQGHPVATTAPSIVGQLLTWNGSAWAPDNTTYMPVAGGTFTGPVTLAGAATQPNQPATLTQVATAAGVNIGRNYFHNSMFNINQRGSASYGVVAGGNWTADRWIGNIGGAGDTYTISLAAASDPDRAAIGDEAAEQYLSSAFTGGTGTANFAAVAQNLEDVRRLGNKQVTLSFWAYSPTGLRVGVSYTQAFGTGGSPSAAIQTNIGVVTLTTGWARYQLTWTVRSTAGETLGTTPNTSWMGIVFWFSCPPANTTNYATSGNLGAQTGTVNLWGAQLEVGSQATPFEHRDPEIELALCQRFYTFYPYLSYSGYQVAAGNALTAAFTHSTTMRTSPTWTNSPDTTSNISALNYSGGAGNATNFQFVFNAAGYGFWGGWMAASADL